MKISLTSECVESLKRELRQALPHVSSSHRIAALARGLGWASNAAMRVALAKGSVERELKADAFTTYLSAHDLAGDGQIVLQSALRVQIRAVMAKCPQLTHFGFGVFEGQRLSVDAWREEMAKNRASMLDERALREFSLAVEHLSRLERIKTPNRKHSSYGLKHAAERYHRRNRFANAPGDAYVSNGMLLAAAYHLGSQVTRAAWNSPNAYLNISNRSFAEVEAVPTPPPPPEPGQHFRVLGHDRGVFFYLPAGAKRVVALRAAAHIPAKLVKLAPLEHWISLFPPRDRRSPFNTAAAVSNLFEQASHAGIYSP